MSGKLVAAIGITLFVVFATALVWVAIYVRSQTVRCAQIGATYDSPGVCKITQETKVPTP